MWFVQVQTLADRVLKFFGLQRIPATDNWREYYHDQDVYGNSVRRVVWSKDVDENRPVHGYIYYEGGGLEELSTEYWRLVPIGADYDAARQNYLSSKKVTSPSIDDL